jgi:hypothetical protein
MSRLRTMMLVTAAMRVASRQRPQIKVARADNELRRDGMGLCPRKKEFINPLGILRQRA